MCVFSSPSGLWFSSGRLRGEVAGLCGGVLGEVGSPAVLHDLGPEPAHAARTETQEQVRFQSFISFYSSLLNYNVAQDLWRKILSKLD